MGMFDNVNYEMDCPNCGARLTDFQSKDGDCCLGMLELVEVNNFYTSCDKCGTWIEFNRKEPTNPVPIEDYEMTYNVPK